jgi:hypothetical protein
MLAARLRRRARGRDAALPPYPEIYLPYARDRSFADIGTMWSVNGRYAFEAEAGGASKVTAVDVMVPTEEFERELARRGSEVRFVRADITQRESLAAVGTHEVVWCSGVVYHQPNPLTAVEHLAAICSDVLLVQSATIPEVPGLPQACVLFPGLGPADRAPYARVFPDAIGLGTDFDPDATVANWWWGITPSALRGMVSAQAGFSVERVVRGAFGTVVIARRA